MRLRRLLALLGFLHVSAAAPGFAGGSQDADVAPESPIDHAANHDAAAGRSYAMGTALTQKEGSFTLTWRQPLLPAGYVSVTGALSDRIELTTGVGYIAGGQGDSGATPSFSVKAQIWRGELAALAVQAGAYAPASLGDPPSTVGHVEFASVLGSVCGPPSCGTLLSVHVTAMHVPGATRDQIDVLGGASFSAGGDHARLLVEGDLAQLDASGSQAALVLAGGRFPFEAWTLDTAIGAVIDPNDDILPVIPILYFAASVRL